MTTPEFGRAIAASRNPNTPVAVLEKLAGHESLLIRTYISMNKGTPLHVLEYLAKDFCPSDIKKGLLKNPNSSRGILDTFMESVRDLPSKMSYKIESVRFYIAKHPNADALLLEFAAESISPLIRSSAARHKNISLLTLLKLSHDSDDAVIEAALNNPTLSNAISGRTKFYIQLDTQGFTKLKTVSA